MDAMKVGSSHQLGAMLDNELVQRFAFQVAVRDDALIVIVVDDLPRFGARFIAYRFVKDGFESVPTPDITSENGFESEWVHSAKRAGKTWAFVGNRRKRLSQL
jgi:hypothetical protein